MTLSLFGTDGVRGIANEELTAELAYRLSRSAGRWFKKESELVDERPRVMIGCDTRISGDMLRSAVVAGLTSIGIDAVVLGIVPTPAVARAAIECSCAVGGVVISASHNPAEYNGIKLFTADGHKLSSQDEMAIEKQLKDAGCGSAGCAAENIGREFSGGSFVASYLQYLMTSLNMTPNSLSDLNVVLDCANGAAYRLGPWAFQQVGASVEVLFDDPDGKNINVNCGSTHPEQLRGRMLSSDHDIGLAFDGDADRLLAVSPGGRLLDGDDLLYIIARHLYEQDRLPANKIVTTVINNRGLDASLKPLGIEVIHSSVGDREIMAVMQREDVSLGGETSGHILLGDYATSGDGILTGLLVSDILIKSGQSLDSWLKGLEKYPQVKRNVRVEHKDKFAEDEVIEDAIAQANHRLKPHGRLVVRPSGTEPVIRVIVEGPDFDLLEELADELAEVIHQRLMA